MSDPKLPWMPLYVGDLMTDLRFKNLSGDQMAAYLWLLMTQWIEGDLPYDLMEMTNALPRGIPDTAFAYTLLTFFPADPDTNRRANPRLATIRIDQLALHARKKAQTAAATAAALAKKASVTDTVTDSVTDDVTDDVTAGEVEVESKSTVLPTTATLPVQVATSLEPYITGQRYAAAAVAGVAMLLNPEASPHYASAVVAQALVEMRAEGRPWKLSTLRSWCANLSRQAREAPQRPVGAPNGAGAVPGVHLAPREARMADTLTQFVERHRGDH